MFGFKKKQEYTLGQFSRLVCQGIITNSKVNEFPENDQLPEEDRDLMSSEEVKLFNKELLYFRIILLHFLLADRKLGYSSYDVGHTVAVAYGLALRDSGYSKEKSIKDLRSNVLMFKCYNVWKVNTV